MIAEGTRLKDRYRLERLLGRGGMASVWLAEDEVLDRPVAIKLLSDTIASDPEFLARFRREARVAASLSHPNLIGVYDYAEGEERPYLVMEHVAGDNLAERMSKRARIDCERLARELLGALAHIHAAGIVHRDVKPQNVLIAPDGSVKLIDFGIALPKDATALTRTGNLLGTARYIAPEVMGGQPATERADLYSCGVVLRDCMGDDPPANLRGLVAHLSTVDPRGRPASAKQALARLDRKPAAVGQTTQRLEPISLRRERTPPRRETTPLRRQPTPSRGEAPRRGSRPGRRAAALLATLAALAAAFLIANDDPGDTPGGNGGSKVAAAESEGGPTTDDRGAEAAGEDTEATDEGAEATATVPAPTGTDPELGSTLNLEGFELIQAGRYEDAVPVLEEAVSAFPPGTEDVNYAYALFNLGNALRLSGRPEEAIPVLERRLEIPNQTAAVRGELEAARRETGSP
jgi:eukaryotic-like serine/threonine-protein kinase